MSLFGTVSRPATGVCVLKFHQQSVVHAQAAEAVAKLRFHLLHLWFFSHTHAQKPGRRTAG